MASSDPSRRPPLVVAIEWVQQVTTVALEMALPAALGAWLDQRWGTTPGLVSVGAVLGFIVAMRHLLQLARRSAERDRSRRRESNSKD